MISAGEVIRKDFTQTDTTTQYLLFIFFFVSCINYAAQYIKSQ